MNLGKEDEAVEFKKSIAELKEGVISLAAMLNKTGKGTLYFGVAEDGNVIGLPVAENTEKMISKRIHDFIEPHIKLKIKVETTPEGLNYTRVDAHGCDSPYSIDGFYYVRLGNQDKIATREDLKKMIVGSGFDFIKESNATRQDLHFTQLISLLVANGNYVKDLNTFIQDEGLLTEEGKFNQMAELLSDESNVSIKVVRFSTKDKSILSQRTEFGNKCMILAMQQAMDYVQCLDETNVDMRGPRRKDIPLFDFEVFCEAWINACLHNSWHELIPPAIYIFSDRLEIVSNGGIPFGISKEEFFQGKSHPINKALRMIFDQLGYLHQMNHGVPMIVNRYGKDAFSLSDYFVTVRIPYAFTPEWVFRDKEQEEPPVKLTSTQRKVLKCVKNNPRETEEKIATEIKMSLSTVKKTTKKLSEMGFLSRKGSRKNGYWLILKKE